MRGRVLIVAGSDSGGGAGIQADLKTVLALGAHGMTAVTALTAQDTLGVHGVMPVPPDFVVRQMEVALNDPGADVVKTGMLGTAAVIEAVAAVLARAGLPVVLDPVMVAKGGAALLDPAALDALRSFLPLATLLTPNLPEAAALLGRPVDDPREAAQALLALGPRAVLLKGGHGEGPTVRDVLATADGLTVLDRPRIDTRHTHGTGCTLASAVAAGLAHHLSLLEAVEQARDYVQAAIAAAPGIGAGHGPLDHGAMMRRPSPRAGGGAR